MNNSVYVFTFFCLLLNGCTLSKKSSRTHEERDNEFLIKSNGSAASMIYMPSPPDSFRNSLANKNKLLLEKYAAVLSISPDSLNIKLYTFIDSWMNTPYKWGGTDKNGIDCSAFIRCLFDEVYKVKLPRTSLEQVLTQQVERFRSIKYLAEGDILFFKTIPGTRVSHVGFYLRNNQFINSSSQKGVVIYSFNEYWRRRFVTAARVKVSEAKRSLNHNIIKR